MIKEIEVHALREAMAGCVVQLRQLGRALECSRADWEHDFDELVREVSRVRRLLAAGEGEGRQGQQLNSLRRPYLSEKKRRERPRLRDLFDQEFNQINVHLDPLLTQLGESDPLDATHRMDRAHTNRSLSLQVRGAMRILAVEDDASADEIRRAYRDALRQSHPDLTQAPSGERLAEVREAWKILKDHFPDL